MSSSRETLTTCPYCGVGCGVLATVADGTVTRVVGSDAHPANLGRLCVKGSTLHETMGLQGRLLYPQVAGQRTDWNTALDVVSQGFLDIIERHGRHSVAFYLSGQLLTEDYYVANKLMKGFIGTANVDTNSRLCMASAVAAYNRAFGADAVPCSYEDLECCNLLVMVGSNAAWTHPVIYQRIAAAKAARPHMKVVVIDPRRTATCDLADLHLGAAPGSDGFIFSALLRYLSDRQCLNQRYIENHTEGFEQALTESCTLDDAVLATGLERAELEQFFRWFARTEATVTLYSQGVNQSATGTDKCNAIINCHLATGRLGKPGAGPFSITGQPNAMGGREVGGLSSVLAAHMDFSSENVQRLARFWETDNVATAPGLKAVDMFNAIESGAIKAVWIMATNPVVSLPESDRIRHALSQCELVVVSDCIKNTDTTACADILLPAAGWGEKDGTVTNSERRISRQRALLPCAGEARPDWQIISDVANRMGFGQFFNYDNPAAIFREHAALSGFENGAGASRAFNISALADISDMAYDHLAPVQWPVCHERPTGSARMFSDGQFFTHSGKAQFLPLTASLPQREEELPFVLNSGRVRDQWHTMTRTGRSSTLLAHIDRPMVAISPRDAQSANIYEGDLLRLSNRHGNILLQAVIDSGQRDGELFAPIHWNDQFASKARVSTLFSATRDPVSGQPQSKFATVSLKKVRTGGWAQIVSRIPLGLEAFEFWIAIPEPEGWRYALALPDDAFATAYLAHWLQPYTAALQKAEFSNANTGAWRAMYCDQDNIVLAIFLARELTNLPDFRSMTALLTCRPDADAWRLLGARPQEADARMICTCHQVTKGHIRCAIEAGTDSVAGLGMTLRCGTNCGSCIPELKRLLSEHTILARENVVQNAGI